MCYLVARKMFDDSSIVLKTKHGTALVKLKEDLSAALGNETVQLITISKPSAFGECRPYVFAENEAEFRDMVLRKLSEG